MDIKNIGINHKGTELILTVRLNKAIGPASELGVIPVASTNGFQPIETADGFRVRLDVDRLETPEEKAAREVSESKANPEPKKQPAKQPEKPKKQRKR